MARILQGSGAEDTQSPAEQDMLSYFEQLPDEYTVIHSVKWITHNVREHGSVGEADFVLAHPEHGVLVLEVKGGQIKVERNVWSSLSRNGTVYTIKDPFAQADRSRYALLDWLHNDERTRRLDFAVYSAVAFPDVDTTADLRPDAPQAIVIDATRLNALKKTLREIFAYWHKRYPTHKMGGRAAVEALVSLLVPTRQLHQRVATIFERERRKIEVLTQQQFRVLRLLQHHRQAVIVGGAGTGKTMLAMEKAQQLANAGFRVLFLCFNRNLAEWIGGNLKHPKITVTTYHSLAGRAINWVDMRGLAPIAGDEFYQKAPDLLLDAAARLHKPELGAQDKLFDAIIVDEAQDFEEHWWIPLPEFLKDAKQGIFYVFFDHNQRIYTQISNVPIDIPPFPLDENCRNTQKIHAALTPYVHGGEKTICLGPPGRPVEHIPADDETAGRKALRQVLHRLVKKDGISPKDIIILSPRSEKNSWWKEGDKLGPFTLTWKMKAHGANTVRVCTIYSFKGLESPVVILAQLDQAKEEVHDQLIYVGLSRARNHAVVIGPLPEPHVETQAPQTLH